MREGGAAVRPLAVAVVLVLSVAVLWVVLRGGDGPDLVVYCAHDRHHAEPVIRAFEEATGLDVEVRWDTEASKSLALVESLRRERDDPRADVFWNNELLGTLALARDEVLASYRGEGWKRTEDAFRDPEARWVGFGARMRVMLVNTERMEDPDHEKVAALLAGDDLSEVAIAKPLFGTTLTHYSALWHEQGGDWVRAWHEDLRERGIREVDGNAVTKNLVANGACTVGFTDTDDSFLAIEAGDPVAMLPYHLPSGRTIAIPNSVAIIAGCSHRPAAERFVDFLCSEATEIRLARGTAHQIPLGPVPEDELPDEVRALIGPAAESIPMRELVAAREACLAWLKELYGL